MTIDPWSKYWGSGSSTSFATDAGSGFTKLDSLWRGFATDLLPSSYGLELAAGPAVVSRIIAPIRPDVNLIASDAADIPVEVRDKVVNQHPNILFSPREYMEDLSHPDQRFDAIYSQFGFEYGDRKQVLLEVNRVGKPECKIFFVIHCKGGEIYSASSQKRRELKVFGGQGGVLDQLINFLDGSLSVSKFKHNMLEVGKELGFKETIVAGQLYQSVETIFLAGNRDVANAKSLAKDIRLRVLMDLERTEQMLSSAMSESDMVGLIKALHADGINASKKKVRSDRGGVIAWVLNGQRLGEMNE